MLPRGAGQARPSLWIWMVCMGVLLCAGAVVCFAQSARAADGTNQADTSQTAQWRSGLSEIDEGWAEHAGDNMRWAQPGFDSSGWTQVDLDDLGAATVGWRWYRKRVELEPGHPHVHLLIAGGDGTYELYVNGVRAEGSQLHSDFDVKRPTERVFPLDDDASVYVLALRTRTPPNYAGYHLPLFLSVTLGQPTAIDYERQALESQRLYDAVPTIAINLLVFLGGLFALALYANQRGQRDYLFLGLYLLLVGLSNGMWTAQQNGILPTWANSLFADPLTYLFSIAQIEFTFSFARQRMYRWVRAYEFLLLAPLLLVIPNWMGHFSPDTYLLVEAAVQAPVALLMPVFLLVWYRRGNREAGLLILPSLFPSAVGTLYDLGAASINMGWGKFDFLDNPINLGPIPVHTTDLANLFFLFAIGMVMFFRFTRVSREQARSAAELEAAREIQQRLVPAVLPALEGWCVEAAYLPAQEVGGDFYQVLEQGDGSTLIALGDVSGKGLKAAMTGALAIGALRTLAAEGLGPAELLARLNRQMLEAQDGGFVTCVAARVAPGGELTLANAGHLEPYRNGQEIRCEPGLPLGIVPGAAYAEATILVESMDRLTFLSDGVVEARSASGELLGFERTRELSMGTAADIAMAAQAFGQEDDITVLTLEFAPVAAPVSAA
ncbi:MAG TPA: PP2C family protein-serine/threonine phosphatase, partial [Terracidiphilus sp.]|nr:PP2C family protein-serine/threonine phosphatase [Terracidiphilus sp.]